MSRTGHQSLMAGQRVSFMIVESCINILPVPPKPYKVDDKKQEMDLQVSEMICGISSVCWPLGSTMAG